MRAAGPARVVAAVASLLGTLVAAEGARLRRRGPGGLGVLGTAQDILGAALAEDDSPLNTSAAINVANISGSMDVDVDLDAAADPAGETTALLRLAGPAPTAATTNTGAQQGTHAGSGARAANGLANLAAVLTNASDRHAQATSRVVGVSTAQQAAAVAAPRHGGGDAAKPVVVLGDNVPGVQAAAVLVAGTADEPDWQADMDAIEARHKKLQVASDRTNVAMAHEEAADKQLRSIAERLRGANDAKQVRMLENELADLEHNNSRQVALIADEDATIAALKRNVTSLQAKRKAEALLAKSAASRLQLGEDGAMKELLRRADFEGDKLQEQKRVADAEVGKLEDQERGWEHSAKAQDFRQADAKEALLKTQVETLELETKKLQVEYDKAVHEQTQQHAHLAEENNALLEQYRRGARTQASLTATQSTLSIEVRRLARDNADKKAALRVAGPLQTHLVQLQKEEGSLITQKADMERHIREANAALYGTDEDKLKATKRRQEQEGKLLLKEEHVASIEMYNHEEQVKLAEGKVHALRADVQAWQAQKANLTAEAKELQRTAKEDLSLKRQVVALASRLRASREKIREMRLRVKWAADTVPADGANATGTVVGAVAEAPPQRREDEAARAAGRPHRPRSLTTARGVQLPMGVTKEDLA